MFFVSFIFFYCALLFLNFLAWIGKIFITLFKLLKIIFTLSSSIKWQTFFYRVSAVSLYILFFFSPIFSPFFFFSLRFLAFLSTQIHTHEHIYIHIQQWTKVRGAQWMNLCVFFSFLVHASCIYLCVNVNMCECVCLCTYTYVSATFTLASRLLFHVYFHLLTWENKKINTTL